MNEEHLDRSPKVKPTISITCNETRRYDEKRKTSNLTIIDSNESPTLTESQPTLTVNVNGRTGAVL